MGYGKLILMLGNLFTIQRWNNKPSIVKFSEADNAFSSLLISFALREYYHMDIESSLKWRLSRVLPKLVLSDISLELKERVERLSPDVWEKVRQKAFQELYKITGRSSIEGLIMHKFDNIDKYADVITSLFEAKVNGKVFDFEKPIKELKEKLDNFSKDFDEVKDIPKIIFSIVLNMVSMIRWNRMYRNIKTTVAGHSFIVVTIAYIISLQLKMRKEEIEEIIKRALLHDLPEAFTGDVITPTKKKTPELDALVSKVEKEMFNEWIKENPKISYLKKFENIVSDPFSNHTGQIVRTADYFAALLECSLEIFSGNKERLFREVFFDLKKKLKNFENIDLGEWIDEIEDIVF
ncbi:phosphohydrolase [Thermosipho melanesiensis]|uniref:Metal dependent phosphohydrolase n=2 Tax=Thermosipho melanesiensis TaxID=46541 RepID=A6LKK6_THEM4|nr:YfbR-like 5'-deoxynucleotidase [Thermosipho melanesiensis]ABR30457.1 metal dependent phosphohydrolase [Thermosipho melanesiensis BI429]APT73617.1 phosphohydrolase [Thermosipho melanesiensis]OOC37564.1 phosphohydrolase [Thermosipho melanesiensis]OOC39460.1 phosphohydrolase [Thermosipho melanesiensis]OOC39523.1 phosphohydrolase [Thermosipho melanesiensis]